MANFQAIRGIDRDVELGSRIRLYRRKVTGLVSLEAFAARMLESGHPLTVDQLGDIERGSRPCGAIELDLIACAIEDVSRPFQSFIGINTMSLSSKIQATAKKLVAETSAPENTAYDQEIAAITKVLTEIGVEPQTIKTAYSVTPQLDFTVEGVDCSIVSSDTTVSLTVGDRQREIFGKTEGGSFTAFNQETLEAAIVSAVGAIVSQQTPIEPAEAITEDLAKEPQPAEAITEDLAKS